MTRPRVTRRRALATAAGVFTGAAATAAVHAHRSMTLPVSIEVSDAHTETDGERTWITALDVRLEQDGAQAVTLGAWTWHDTRPKYVYWPATGQPDGQIHVAAGSVTSAVIRAAHPRGRLPEGVRSSLVVMTPDGHRRSSTTIDTASVVEAHA